MRTQYLIKIRTLFVDERLGNHYQYTRVYRKSLKGVNNYIKTIKGNPNIYYEIEEI